MTRVESLNRYDVEGQQRSDFLTLQLCRSCTLGSNRVVPLPVTCAVTRFAPVLPSDQDQWEESTSAAGVHSGCAAKLLSQGRKGETKLAKLGEIAAGCRLQRERQRNARLDKAHLPTRSANIFMSKVVMFSFRQTKCHLITIYTYTQVT